jgi:hypothetical protein
MIEKIDLDSLKLQILATKKIQEALLVKLEKTKLQGDGQSSPELDRASREVKKGLKNYSGIV